MYTSLFKTWTETPGVDAASDLRAMLMQRVNLNLAPDLQLAEPLTIVPVAALGTPIKSPGVLIPRMRAVQNALLDAGVGWLTLEVWEVQPDGSHSLLAW